MEEWSDVSSNERLGSSSMENFTPRLEEVYSSFGINDPPPRRSERERKVLLPERSRKRKKRICEYLQTHFDVPGKALLIW